MAGWRRPTVRPIDRGVLTVGFLGHGQGQTDTAGQEPTSALEQARAGPRGPRACSPAARDRPDREPPRRRDRRQGPVRLGPEGRRRQARRATPTPRRPSTPSSVATSSSRPRAASSPVSAGSSRCRWRCRPTSWSSTSWRRAWWRPMPRCAATTSSSQRSARRCCSPSWAPTPTTCSRRPVCQRPGRLSNLAAQRLPGPALMVVNKAVGVPAAVDRWARRRWRGSARACRSSAVSSGAGLDAYLLKRIADHARHEFPRRARAH